jgi:hypothetical protein
MTKTWKIAAPMLAVTLLSAMSCTGDREAPPEPVSTPGVLKEGWDRKQIKVFAYACTDGLLEPAARDYYAAAKRDGVDDPKPFPEQPFRDSAFPMCLCISERVAETWALAEIKTHSLQKAQGFINDAMNGGRCKPDGMLGDILKNSKP